MNEDCLCTGFFLCKEKENTLQLDKVELCRDFVKLPVVLPAISNSKWQLQVYQDKMSHTLS